MNTVNVRWKRFWGLVVVLALLLASCGPAGPSGSDVLYEQVSIVYYIEAEITPTPEPEIIATDTPEPVIALDICQIQFKQNGTNPIIAESSARWDVADLSVQEIPISWIFQLDEESECDISNYIFKFTPNDPGATEFEIQVTQEAVLIERIEETDDLQIQIQMGVLPLPEEYDFSYDSFDFVNAWNLVYTPIDQPDIEPLLAGTFTITWEIQVYDGFSDYDGDGVLNYADLCPGEKGTVENSGCISAAGGGGGSGGSTGGGTGGGDTCDKNPNHWSCQQDFCDKFPNKPECKGEKDK